MRHSFLIAVASVSLLAAAPPEDEFAGTVKMLLGKAFENDWTGLEKVPQTTWAPLPPRMLQNCLPDGGCFTRQGAAQVGDRELGVMVTGARTMASNFYFRNPGPPIAEESVLASLKAAGLKTALARCPLAGGAGGTNWYKVTGAAMNPGVLSIQSSCNGKPCEGFVVTLGADLPQLQPNQLKLYSEQCSSPASERKPVSTALPHEQLAQTIAALIPPTAGPALSDWKTLMSKQTAFQWSPGVPRKTDLTFKSDPNPFSHSGSFALPGRQFSLLVSGSPTQPKVIYIDENGMHPRGERLLGVMYTFGYQVNLVRCGPVYTESTNNWYNLTSANSHPVMLKQSIRSEGNRVQDAYELRLDSTLPARDPRDRDPGVQGCR